jgi:hypothetical protein
MIVQFKCVKFAGFWIGELKIANLQLFLFNFQCKIQKFRGLSVSWNFIRLKHGNFNVLWHVIISKLPAWLIFAFLESNALENSTNANFMTFNHCIYLVYFQILTKTCAMPVKIVDFSFWNILFVYSKFYFALEEQHWFFA